MHRRKNPIKTKEETKQNLVKDVHVSNFLLSTLWRVSLTGEKPIYIYILGSARPTGGILVNLIFTKCSSWNLF